MVEGGATVQSDEDEYGWLADESRTAWSRRPYARTFDLIAAEYGWTHDTILDMPLCTFRQTRDVIFERRSEERRERLRDKEVELRVLASRIAASAGDKDGVAAAQAITLLSRPEDAPRKVKYMKPEQARRFFGEQAAR